MTRFALLALALLVSACASETWDVDKARTLPITGSSFDKALHDEYVALAATERAEYDWNDAKTFVERATAAAAGNSPEPEPMAARKLPPEHVADLTSARKELMEVFTLGARAMVAGPAARAQAMFECWMQEQEENIVPEQLPDIAYCRDGFKTAMATIRKKLNADLMVLLPDLDGGVGAIVVGARQGKPSEATRLDKALQGTRVASATAAPDQPFAVSEKDVNRIWGKALAAQPIPPRTYIFRFLSGTTELDPASKAQLPEIVADIKARPTYEIAITGHTDRVGGARTNARLSAKRAASVKDYLVGQGFDGKAITTAGHGEDNPVVPTADGVAEPKNRRVEVIVR